MGHPGWGTGPVERILPIEPRADHYIVCGANALAHRLVVELTEQYGVFVVAIVPSRELDHAPQMVKLLGESAVIAAPAITEEALRSAEVATARAIALVDGDDQGNIHAALRAQALNGDIRVVLRMYNQRLGSHVEGLFNDCTALSGSATAAPAFVNAALRRPNSVQVGGRSVSVAFDPETVADAGGTDFLCTIADQIDKQDLAQMRLLPEPPGAAATWIGEVPRQPPVAPGSRAVLRFLDGERPEAPSWYARLRWRTVDLRRYLGTTKLSRVFLWAFVAVLVSFITVWYLNGRFAWALYDTLLDTAGAATPDTFGQTSQTGGAWQRVAQVVVTFCGIMFIPVATAIVLDTIARGRPGTLRQPSAGVRDHVVVFGLGNVGTRVATLMHGLGVPVVCIESDPNARGIAAARGMDIPVLVGEAPLEDQLRRARVHTSRAVLALTDDDAANLEAALEARALAPDVRVVLRLFDDDFATQVYRTFTNAASRSVSYLAAPAFAAALMGREVLGTLSVYRQVVLIAEFVADPGSDLVGRTLREIEVPGEVRVIAVRSTAARDYLWRPDSGRHIGAGDRYVLLATRAGLGRHTGHFVAAAGQGANGHYPGFQGTSGRDFDPAADEIEIVVYLSDAESGEAVRAAVEDYLAALGAQITEDNDPVIGSWLWFAKAKRLGRAAARSEVGHNAATLAESLAWAPVRSRQAEINLVNSQAVANLVHSLSGCTTGLVLIGSLLVVKNGNVPIVVMLSQEQVNELERRPALLRRPETILEDLQHLWADGAVDSGPPTLAT